MPTMTTVLLIMGLIIGLLMLAAVHLAHASARAHSTHRARKVVRR